MPKQSKRKSRKQNPTKSGNMIFMLGPQAVAEILRSVHPDRSPLPAQLKLAEGMINSYLWEIKSKPDHSKADVCQKYSQFKKSFKIVNRGLNDSLLRSMLKAAGREFEDPPPGVPCAPLEDPAYSGDHIEDVVQQLDCSLKEPLAWLEYDEKVDLVTNAFAPKRTTHASLIRSLARAYEAIFREDFAVAREGAGPTFILEIFRRSGIHDGNQDTIRELIRKTLHRWRKRKSVSANLRHDLKILDGLLGKGIILQLFPLLLFWLKECDGEVWMTITTDDYYAASDEEVDARAGPLLRQ
jgi:hypothetical protein